MWLPSDINSLSSILISAKVAIMFLSAMPFQTHANLRLQIFIAAGAQCHCDY
jgi:hypothetical protein